MVSKVDNLTKICTILKALNRKVCKFQRKLRIKKNTFNDTTLKEVNDSRIYFLSSLQYKNSDIVLFTLDKVFLPDAKVKIH